MRNMHIGAESGLILPQVLDDKGEQYFKFEVVNVSGSKSYDVAAVIESYKMEILTALYATVLTAGQGGGGSFALSTSLQEMVDMIIEAKLEEMRDVFNHTLIPYLWKLNGWDMTVLPTFEWETSSLSITPPTYEQKTKAYYQLLAAGGVAITARNINHIAEQAGFPERLPEDWTSDQVREVLSNADSRAGDGFATTGDGTSSSPKGDSSATNAHNKA